MKLTNRHHDSGALTVERVAKRHGRNAKELVRQNETTGLGPFNREENPARTGCAVGATLARNYHSVSIQVTINIPAHPTEKGVEEGLNWCFRKANSVLNEELKSANRALDKLARRRNDDD